MRVAERDPSSAAGAMPGGKGRLARSPQWLRFFVVGTFNTGVSFGAYLLLLALGLPFALANLLALVLGIVVSFRTQGSWVFDSTDWSRLRRFVPTWLLIYVFNVAAIALLVRWGLTPQWAGLTALPFVVVLSYALQRLWVFRQDARPVPGVTDANNV